jgi:hypothetical protein
MKKNLLIALALICASLAHGQDQKEKVAIYTTDNSGQNIVEFVGDFLTNAIVKRGQYMAIERTAQFLAELNKEQSFQRGGAVDDSQISRLGKNMGVQLVCVVKIGKSGEQLFISARLVDVETAALKSTARPVRFDADNWDEIEKSCETITASMFGERNRSSTAFGNPSGTPANGSVYNPDGIEMVYVEGTGSGILAIPGFYIGKYEVTQAQYEAIMGVNPSHFKGPNHPVESVSWNDAQEFITKLNARTGRNYRLPTVAEWEYAAREGKNKSYYQYSGSDGIGAVAWYDGNSGGTTHAVGGKIPNALGIHDMSGNIAEMCSDIFTEEGVQMNKIRGGDFSDTTERGWLNIAHPKNNYDKTTHRSYIYGFRVLMNFR